ncbi:MAG: cation:proton antiporter, partial [Anaeroplasmataceae bacterium]|nr:cation:proton antiporter [Anaeroplasmataceae bacterium]
MVPVSIILGILLGIVVGFLLSFIYKRLKTPLLTNVIITLAMSFLCIGLENYLKKWISISSLLAIMVLSMILLLKNEEQAKELSKGYNILWKVFEIILFVLVGASLDFKYVLENCFSALAVLGIGLGFRCVGVLLSVIGTSLTWKERAFVIVSYLPKATVQASIGGIALSLGLHCGPTILMVSILAILITAPLGAILIDHLKSKLLNSLPCEVK